MGSGIAGSFNQANLASRAADVEKNRARLTEEQRLREARKRFAAVQEEVAQTETLRGRRVEPDKEETDGQDAHDQYESHEELSRRQTKPRKPPQLDLRGRQADQGQAPDSSSGHIIDLEA